MQTKTDVLRGVFGFSAFRPGQETIIDATLSGRDVLAVMPTGGGKSLCYQIPALMSDGVAFVISPLISLMKDQVGQLRQSGVAAAYLNSTLTPGQYRKALVNAESGMYKIIYIAPERLTSPDFIGFARNNPPSMIAVDEAHCVSHWGRDFRPSYLDIRPFVDNLPVRPALAAFTATATERVRQDITDMLGLVSPVKAIGTFDRPNLYFEVLRGRGGRARDDLLLSLLAKHYGESGIIYCSTRKAVDAVYELLLRGSIKAGRYHAGMTDDERRDSQDSFAADDTPVLVATNAFGMGIDKSNVSFIIHYNMPGDLESYYQEAGRAGRDGSDARCTLLFSPSDIFVRRNLIDSGEESRDPESRQRALSRLEDMIAYATGGDCLRARLLRYFGETPPDRCESCGNCNAPRKSVDTAQFARSAFELIRASGGYFAPLTLARALHGADNASRADTSRNERLRAMPGYGAYSAWELTHINACIQALLEQGYIRHDVSPYHSLRLLPPAFDVLNGAECTLDIVIRDERGSNESSTSSARKRASRAAASSIITNKEIDNELFERLRTLRTRIAKAQGVPPYVVFSNATLEDMCRKRPQSMAAMLLVTGVGEHKVRAYGEAFLAELRAT